MNWKTAILMVVLLFGACIPAFSQCQVAQVDSVSDHTQSVLVQVPVASQDVVEAQRIRDHRDRSEKLGARRALQRLARKLKREGKRKERDLILQVLKDPQLFDALYYGRIAPQMVKIYGAQDETPILDFWRDLIEYVIDNQDKIIDFIKKIIDLFAINVRPRSVTPPNQDALLARLAFLNWLHYGQVRMAV